MPYLESAQSWLTQSTLLLQARPTTTRITTKYNIAHSSDSPNAKPKSSKSRISKPASTPAEAATPPVRATLTLKTYDPASGVTLKYTTTKAAEVSRLIQILGRLARPMAGLPEVKEEVVMADVEGGEGTGTATPVIVEQVQQGGKAGPGAGGQAQSQGGAGGKKKKKGKK